MAKIQILDQNTINKIAAGEVIERPASVVKELVENAIDAGATAVSVEIKDGGLSLIRVTDNGMGFEKDDIDKAFLRHSTSKIKSVEDLFTVTSLGFRGEALSSIAAIAQVELITKQKKELTGMRYVIEGGEKKSYEEIGCPDGTTFLVRNIFYNTPVRRGFLKSAQTEGAYVADLLERMSLSKPDISFKLIANGQIKLHTSGNSYLKDVIYTVYGRDIANNLLKVNGEIGEIKVEGYCGKPIISRGNRSYENYFINGRYIKSDLIISAIEQAYKTYMPQHKYPFVILHITVNSRLLDVNVHPTKMEIRFKNKEELHKLIFEAIKNALEAKELIPQADLIVKKEEAFIRESTPEPFEAKRIELNNKTMQEHENKDVQKMNEFVQKNNGSIAESKPVNMTEQKQEEHRKVSINTPKQLDDKNITNTLQNIDVVKDKDMMKDIIPISSVKKEPIAEQINFLSEKSVKEHRIIGQLFETYWLVELDKSLYIIDQHAAHERILYERFMKEYLNKQMSSQQLMPPVIITLSLKEREILRENLETFELLGFEIENFGGKEYSLRAVPYNLYNLPVGDIFIELLDSFNEEHNKTGTIETIFQKIAKLSCKAAVKGNTKLSYEEVEALIKNLLDLDNPYTCPHGRPTIILMTQYEIERKFKRIQ